MTHRIRRGRPAFTLVELLVAVAIIGILATTILMALYGTMEDAREARTKSQVTRIHALIMQRWESYRTKPVPLRVGARQSPRHVAQIRLAVLRDIQRMELPDRITDVADGPSPIYINASNVPVGGTMTPVTPAAPSLWKAYDRFVATRWGANWRTTGGWTKDFQGAECLYMILANIKEGGSTGLDFFREREIGDVDGDLMPEILDAWGRPIEFLRSAPGFSSQPGFDNGWGVLGVDDDNDGVIDNTPEANWPGSDDFPSPSDLQSRNSVESPDPFDFLRVDYRWYDNSGGITNHTNDPFALFPLVFSAGRDGIYDIVTDTDASVYLLPLVLRYIQTDRPTLSGTRVPYPNDPYVNVGISFQMGSPADLSLSDGTLDHVDNIHNHLIEAQ